MNRTALSFILSGVLTISVFSIVREVSGEAAPKIAVVSVSEAFEGYIRTKEAKEELQKKRKGLQDHLDALKGTLRGLEISQQALRKGLLKEGLEASRKDEIEAELERKRVQVEVQTNEIRNHVKKANTQVSTFWSKIQREILAEIRKEIEAVGKEKGLDLVFDSSGLTSTKVPALIYQSGQNDLTEEIVKRLNARAAEAGKKGGAEE